MIVSTNATFLEDNYIKEHKPRSKVVLEELLPGSTSIQSTTVVENNIVKTTSEHQTDFHQNHLPSRRSGRVIRLPVHYREIRKSQIAISDECIDDPLTYHDAMKDSDKEE